mmetsp:Transcript_5887/g.23248  ORF Transcript_5887/g.23248 Transcript_5887/m.23248 type:complete len:258 (+) Transcript_5887:2937-3710(+)
MVTVRKRSTTPSMHDDGQDGDDEQRAHAVKRKLVRLRATTHVAEYLSRPPDRVIRAVQRFAASLDGLPLSLQVLQNAHAQVLRLQQRPAAIFNALARARQPFGRLHRLSTSGHPPVRRPRRVSTLSRVQQLVSRVRLRRFGARLSRVSLQLRQLALIVPQLIQHRRLHRRIAHRPRLEIHPSHQRLALRHIRLDRFRVSSSRRHVRRRLHAVDASVDRARELAKLPLVALEYRGHVARVVARRRRASSSSRLVPSRA